VFSVIISVVVLVSVVAAVVHLVLSELPKPATQAPRDHRRAARVRPPRTRPAHVDTPPPVPAVDDDPLPRDDDPLPLVEPPGEPALPLPWWRRLRSAVALAFVLAALGVATAAAVGLLAIAVGAALRRAVG
jgi:hypothetical protein